MSDARAGDAGRWAAFYKATPTGRLPWHSGAPEPELQELVRRGIVKPCPALDVGCGQGTEAVFLALAGFRVTGLDLAAEAIRRARRLARLLGARASFRRGDALRLPFRAGSFSFVNDRGCLHSLDPARRPDYAREVARVLTRRGRLFVRCFSEKAPRNFGPHCFTRAELREALAGAFRIEWIRPYGSLGNGGPPTIPLYACLAARRN